MSLSPPQSLAKTINLIPAGSTDALRKLAADLSGGVFFCAHIGSSMNPTLCELDLLEVTPYGDRSVEIGDVILFLPPEGQQTVGQQPVVHRVMAVTAEGICTHGDNNVNDDAWLLGREQIAGRVVAAWRGEKRRPIAGGRRGRLRGRIMQRLRALDRGVSRRLHPLYHLLARSNIWRRLLPSSFMPRVVFFPGNGGRQMKLLVAGRVVGRYDAQRQQWFIQRPFRLLVDEETLQVSHQLTERVNVQE